MTTENEGAQSAICPPCAATKLLNGTYTIHSARTSEHRTFMVRTQAPDAKFAPGARLVALLNGPDNESDFQSFGFVTEHGIAVYRKKRGFGKLSSFDIFAKMLWALGTGEGADAWYLKGYTIDVSKRCLMCNRKLTHPVSLVTGIGPECAAKAGLDRPDASEVKLRSRAKLAPNEQDREEGFEDDYHEEAVM